MYPSTQSFSPSPAFLLSQMSDPTSVLSNLCSPFLINDVSIESFGDNMVSSLLIPNMKKSILNHEREALQSIPELIKIIIDNLGEEMLDLIKTEILETIITIYLESSEKEESWILDLFCDSVSSISSRFRDDILVESIYKYYTSDNVKLRVLAATIISLVRRNYRIINQFQALSNDTNPKIRLTIIKCLPNCTFNEHITEPILELTAHDESVLVRNEAAKIFGYLTPHMTNTYINLLLDPNTTVSALTCFKQMVNFSEFGQFYPAFIEVIKMFPENAAKALIEIAPIVDSSEHRLLYKCAKLLRNVPEFVESFYQFAKCFGNRKRFLRFFCDKEKMNNEIKKLYAQQLKFFSDEFEFGEKLLPAYMNDSLAINKIAPSIVF